MKYIPPITTRTRSFRHSLFAIRCLVLLVLAAVAPALARADFEQDLKALTQTPHRLAGSDEGRQAAAYIERRLREIGIAEVYPLDMVVWQYQPLKSELQVGETTVQLRPMHPNITVPPVTPPEGLTGRLIYVGKGNPEDYGTRSPADTPTIVVLDYDSFNNWQIAFALGAKAVIFLGDGDETPVQPRYTGIPANLIRMYASASDLGGLDLRQDHEQATLSSHVTWQKRVARNIIARVPGADPTFAGASHGKPESMVFSASFDSWGQVPTLSPGARAAGNVAALLETAEAFHRRPAKRDAVFMFLSAEAQYHAGARDVYDSIMMTPEDAEKLAKAHADERAFVQRMRDLLAQRGLRFGAGVDLGKAEQEAAAQEAGETPADTAAAGAAELYQLNESLKSQADWARDDVSKQLQILRLEARQFGGPAQARLDAVEDTLTAQERHWDDMRRALFKRRMAEFVDEVEARARDAKDEETLADARATLELFGELQRRTLDRFDRRLAELDQLIAIDTQRATLRKAVADRWIVLHVSFNFSGGAATWGVVIGDWTDKTFREVRGPRAEGDTPGYYSGVQMAFKDVVANIADRLSIDPRTISGDTSMNAMFAPGRHFSSGWVAGLYGIYNVSLMTGYDARVRDGHPADTVANLPWQELRRQAAEATRVVHDLASHPGISLQRVIVAFKRSKHPGWSANKPTGDYVGLVVSGSLSEDRPAAGAMMAMWPAPRPNPPNSDMWNSTRRAIEAPGYFPFVLETVDTNGRFSVTSFQSEVMREVATLGTIFDEHGRVQSISTRATQAQAIQDAMRIDLFTGTGHQFATLETYNLRPSQLKVLRAAADTEFRPTRALWGQQGGIGFFYIADQIVEDHVKLFQPMGPVILGLEQSSSDRPNGAGLPMRAFLLPPHLAAQSARDLWELNERRLGQLRLRGVPSPDLELLHSRAKAAYDDATLAPEANAPAIVAETAQHLDNKEASLYRSATLSHRVYQPLRLAMDDLVHAIVMLLLLAIPFAFALERLLVCSTTIYGRILGFTIFFLITFAILYFTHPGFAIASTPIIIFLAFAIILLSSLVIYIVVRKFKTELKAIQGQAVGLHDLEVSHTGTLLAAVSMGMSTMRRRPTRTFLTATTVVALTFTILCFASFSRVIGVRAIPAGVVTPETDSSLLIRKLDYSALPPGVVPMLHGMEGEGGLIAQHWWLVRTDTNGPFNVTRLEVPDPKAFYSQPLDAVMGIPVDELARWDDLAAALGAQRPDASLPEDQKQAAWDAEVRRLQDLLRNGGVFLPAIVEEQLDLKVGQPILLHGFRATYAGVIDDNAVQRLKHLDGESVLPVDFTSITLEGSSGAQANEEELLVADDVEKDFVHLSATQAAFASAEMVRELGGTLNAITIYAGRGPSGEEITGTELGREAAQILVTPVWARGLEGVDRMLLTVLTEVSGGLALAVPLLLGGLIIFGTLLGSISDREKEIYTFSALGLSPGHVGVLFFAEAAVYAVVGGMGGQLLAQFVALAAGALARAGYIAPASINYSSTNALFAIAVVMATVLISAIYPALRASKSANPGLARSWKMPPPVEDDIRLTFPFTVSAYDITGVMSFLAEHFRRHDDPGLGAFAASDVQIGRSPQGNLTLDADLALAPFDLGVTQHLTLTAIPSEIEGVDEVTIHVRRLSGARGDWYRGNKVFMRDLRRQFLLWRTLSGEMIEHYRMETLENLGEMRRRDPEAALV